MFSSLDEKHGIIEGVFLSEFLQNRSINRV